VAFAQLRDCASRSAERIGLPECDQRITLEAVDTGESLLDWSMLADAPAAFEPAARQ